MAVYVDMKRIRFKHMTMCHMLADTFAELQEMAKLIQARHGWLQASNSGIPHYDVPWGGGRVPARRQQAIDCGAIEIGMRETSALMKRIRLDPDRFYDGARPLWLASGRAILR